MGWDDGHYSREWAASGLPTRCMNTGLGDMRRRYNHIYLKDQSRLSRDSIYSRPWQDVSDFKMWRLGGK